MPISPMVLSDTAIQQINSLGGPPLPFGVSPEQLRVVMENVAASQSPLSSCRVAIAMATRYL